MDRKDVRSAILVALAEKALKVTKLRSEVSDKLNSGAEHFGKREVRTAFNEELQAMQEKGLLEVDEDEARILKKGKRRLEKAAEAEEISAPPSKASKATREQDEGSKPGVVATITKELWKTGEIAWRDGLLDASYLADNPDRITRLFCGNLNKTITEDELRDAVPGITFIKWITDKQTREFYGSTFLEMRDPHAASMAVALDKSKLKGRPLKVYYCPPRPGDVWPPVGSRGRISDAPVGSSGPPRRERTPKPPNCRKLFIGNLSYNIDDDTIVDFFKECGEPIGLRWMTRQDTEEFRGCGFIEFGSTEEADKAVRLDGKDVLGRPIRIDWTD